MKRAGHGFLGLCAGLLALLAGAAGATEVKHFRADSRDEFSKGELDGVSLDPLGRLALAERLERVGVIEEPYLFAAARRGDGWVVGTGSSGKVLAIDASGTVSTLFTAPEANVFALLAEADGTVYAATSPNGKVYRLRGGKGEVFFEPGELYIWALARAADGSLLVGTGTAGKLYRVDGAGKGTVLFDSEDTHIRALAPLPGGDVLAGTAGNGLVLRIGRDGTARTLYDSGQPEIVALAVGEGGEAWAAAVNSEASLVSEEGTKAPPAEAGGPRTGRLGGGSANAPEGIGEGEPTPMVTVSEGEDFTPPPAARGRSSRAAKTEILRLAASGQVETVWSFFEETAFTLAFQGGKLWVGTGVEGKLFAYDGTSMVLEQDLDERQIVALTGGAGALGIATTNAAALFRPTGTAEQEGTFTAKPLDAGSISSFGTLAWQGRVPEGTRLSFSARTGLSAEPDATWSPWSQPASGPEVPLGALPPGRYLQWRAELASGKGVSPLIFAVDASYRQQNLKPVIRSFASLDPGQILVPAGFNPGNQAYEPASPNRDGIFTTLTPAPGADEGRTKTLWKKGTQSFKWEVADPNGDSLRYRLEFQPAVAEGAWLPVVDELKASFYSFDATVLPDGLYRFRLTATDDQGIGGEPRLSASQVGEPVTIDHTPPALLRAQRKGDAITLEVADATSPLREAVVSADAGEWQAARPADGLLDGRREALEVKVPPGATLLLLRLTDAAFNVVTLDLMAELGARGGRP